jgi:hypothetical protein
MPSMPNQSAPPGLSKIPAAWTERRGSTPRGRWHDGAAGMVFMTLPIDHRARSLRPSRQTGAGGEDMASVVVRGAASGFAQDVVVDRHRLMADEPTAAGGTDTGPSPYDYLLVALGA